MLCCEHLVLNITEDAWKNLSILGLRPKPCKVKKIVRQWAVVSKDSANPWMMCSDKEAAIKVAEMQHLKNSHVIELIGEYEVEE